MIECGGDMNIAIFANCHGVIYKNMIKRGGFSGGLDNVISYENLNNFGRLKDWFSSADVLVIQPVTNYEDFTIKNLRRYLKKDCLVISVPFYRFFGFWPRDEDKKLNKFSPAAVMFFPEISRKGDVARYLTEEETDSKKIHENFSISLNELKKIDESGDIGFYEDFLKLYKTVPFFRDPYHPTWVGYSLIGSRIIKIINQHFGGGLINPPELDLGVHREYGHFKPIKNIYAKTLGLEFDLNSYFEFTRYDYLSKIISYEEGSFEKINDLNELRHLFLS